MTNQQKDIPLVTETSEPESHASESPHPTGKMETVVENPKQTREQAAKKVKEQESKT